MTTLRRDLRKTLENVVARARVVAERAAKKSLTALAVGDAKGHTSMNAEQRTLRSRLRAHGKQLGDWSNEEKKTQDLYHLISECAYEHWHRMLFARFLAENQLLLEPESGVAISINELKELSQSRARDWVVLAGEFAVTMLPQVFRQDDPVLEVQFAPEDRKRLEELLESLPNDVFTASDSLGWTYQFWQAERKDEINASGDKIGADELPAVTQLFTEDYMVDFLLDNTLGAWRAGKILAASPQLAGSATSEAALRAAVALPHCPWKYLRFIKGTDDKWTPAAGIFDGWPKTAKELTCLDPCMGSGHFVVALFERLVALRMAEEALDEGTALAAVIRDNLFGLEIDPRCSQICAFNLALAAWRRVGHRPLPTMNLACSGLAPNTREVDWLSIAGKNEKLKNGMARLYRLFQDAPVLGSLINTRAAEGDLLEAGFHELQPLLERALAQEIKDDAAYEMAATARGLAKAAGLLAGQFTLVATNVPYLGRGKQDATIRDYCERVYPEAKADLATCFIESSLNSCAAGGSIAVVAPQNWFFMSGYKKLRHSLLKANSWNVVARLGPRAFATIGGEVVNVGLISLSRQTPNPALAFASFDVSEMRTPAEKNEGLLGTNPSLIRQLDQLRDPDAIIASQTSHKHKLLSIYASGVQGLATSDDFQFVLNFWEKLRVDQDWEFLLGAVLEPRFYGGRERILHWEAGAGRYFDHAMRLKTEGRLGGWKSGVEARGKRGVAVRVMGNLASTIYEGEFFDQSSAVIVPHDSQHLAAIWLFCASEAFQPSVRRVDKALKVTNATMVKVPFDLAHWQKVARQELPNGLPKPVSSDPTQWLFNGHPKGSDEPLQVAVARLLGYQWPRQTGSTLPDCPPVHPDRLEVHADTDGIVCLTSLKGEEAAAERLRKLLATAYGREWSGAKEPELLAQVDFAGKVIDEWLRDGFFEQHCTLFHHRPFVWHIWDGERDGFHALVNYHTLAAPNGGGRKTLEKLTYSYLGDWIGRQKAEQKQGKEGSDAKLAAALHLQNELKNVRLGEPPYDLFVRWKPLHEQAIGWEPDINDGVRMNIRPFMIAKTLKGKSIFRKAPKIKWDKDRGKEPKRQKPEFPWFFNWHEEKQDFNGGRDFDGNRWNDLHYSLSAKKDARTRHKEKGR